MFEGMRASYEATMVHDLEDGYRDVLRHILGDRVPLHLGEVHGNILRVLLESLVDDVDVLTAGPPCPPWSSQGLGGQEGDDRAQVYLKVIEIIVFLAKCRRLKIVVVENVSGILRANSDGISFMDKVMHVLQRRVPEFVWEVVKENLDNYHSCQNRVRVILRGLHKLISPSMVPLLPKVSPPLLRDFLLLSFPNIVRASLCDGMQANLRLREQELATRRDAGELPRGAVACFKLDRNPLKGFHQAIMINRTPTLLTKDAYLFVLSVDDIDLCDDAHREVLRFLQCQERLALQGFSPTLYEHLSNDTLARKAAGNAYPPPLIAAVLAPMVDALARFELTSPLASFRAEVVTDKLVKQIRRIPGEVRVALSERGADSARRRQRRKRKRSESD